MFDEVTFRMTILPSWREINLLRLISLLLKLGNWANGWWGTISQEIL